MASRVRPGSPALRKLISPAPTFATVLGKSPRSRSPAPFVYQAASSVSPPRSALTPSPCPSQTSLGTSCPGAASSTVRLVPEGERYAPSSPGSDDSGDSKTSSPCTPFGPGAGDRFSLVTELVSSYYTDGEHIYEVEHEEQFYKNPTVTGPGVRSRVQLCDDARPVRDTNGTETPLEEQKPQLSWFLTLFLMASVTVVRPRLLHRCLFVLTLCS